MKANITLREYAARLGVKQWEIADRLGIAEVTFCKHLRKELPAKERDTIIEIINEIAAEKEAEA